jgi:catecholate siderophore receptor
MRSLLFAAVSHLALAGAAQAQDIPAGQNSPTEVDPIVVTGQARGYLALDTVTATKTDTPLLDVPQSVSVITAGQIDDQAMESMGDVLRYVPGVIVGQGEGNRDQITLRGQNTTADFFIDGVRDDVQYYRPLYNLARVEVLRGPYALTFGRGGGGGIINRVQKAPSLADAFVETRGFVDDFGGYGTWIDWNLPVGERSAVRLNAMAERSRSFRDHVDGRRFAVNPYFATEFSPGWNLGLSYERVDDERVNDRGVPSFQARPLEGFDERFFGVPGVNETTLQADVAKVRLDGQFTSSLSLSTTLVAAAYDKAYVNVFPSGPATSPTGTVPLSAYADETTRDNWLFQSNLVWEVLGGPIENRVMVGVEYGDQDTRGSRLNGTLSDRNLSLTNPVFPTVAFNTPARDVESRVRTASVYAQDQIGLGQFLDIILGLRFDRFDISGTDFLPTPDREFDRVDEMISPRLGLVWKPVETASVYVSYSRSFLPRSGEQFASLTPTTQNLEPEAYENLELGAKWRLNPGLSLTAAVFQLRRTNATTPDPANPVATINVGETRTSGLELGLVGRVTDRWSVSGGYAWQDAHLRDNETVELAQVPEHSLAVWSRHNVTDRLGLGLGVTHQSAQWAAIRTSTATTRLAGFTRVDAAVFYELTPTVDLQLNVENLLDEDYWADAHNNNNLTPGAPRNARLTLSARF